MADGVQVEATCRKDSKVLVKTPKKWKECETTLLIDMWEAHPCQWNIFEKPYHSSKSREKACEQLQSELDISVSDIKAKMISLRAQLV